MKLNIIQIVADDMGYGDFGMFSEGRTRTPAIDRLAAEGVCLTQHYSASTVCAPARAGLLTGRYPHRTGAFELRELRGLCNLALGETTIADVLGGAGYATGLVGKWHNGSLGARFHPNARGFAEFAGFRSGWQDYYDWVLNRNGLHERSDGRYLTDVFTEEAIGFVRRHANEPFFLHLAYNAPHSPMQAPDEEVRPFLEAGFERTTAVCYAMIRVMDRGIERLLDELERLGLAENTLVMFTSDNGPAFERFNCGFSGMKGNVYEGGIRVPMILRWPGGLESGVHCHAVSHFCDWFPTLITAADARVPAELDLDGANILPLLRGESCDVPEVRFWQWNRYQPEVTSDAAVREGDWKLVRPVIPITMWTDPSEQEMDSALRDEPWRHFEPVRGPFPPRELPPPPEPQLFNIAEDPGEHNDLATEHPDRAGRMLGALESWFEQVEAERASIEIWPSEID